MTPRSIVTAASLSLATSALGCAAGPPPAARAAARPDRVYRLDFVLATTEPGKPPTSSAYAMSVEDQGHAELRVGSNVALSPGTRQDVGLVLRASARSVGDAVLVETTTELSQAEEPGAVRKVALRGDVLAAPGASAPVASLEDPTTHRRTTLTVTALRAP